MCAAAARVPPFVRLFAHCCYAVLCCAVLCCGVACRWGEAGYIRIQRHDDGTSQWCGPDTRPGDGVGCNGGPSEVTVCGSCGMWYDSAYPTGANIVGADA